jgi:hypothetical protein
MDEHVDVAMSLNSIGNVRFDVGDHGSALSAYEESLRIYRTV